MDTSRLSQGQLVAGIGGVVLIISLFLDWVSGVTIGGFSTGGSAFDVFSGMDIIMLIIGVAIVGLAAATAGGTQMNLPVNPGLLTFVLGVVLVGWTLGWVIEVDSAGIGAWLGFAASIAIVVGGYMESQLLAVPATSASAPAPAPAAAAPPPPPPPPPAPPPQPSEPAGSSSPPSGSTAPPGA
jgi:hypothetical protein